MFISIREMAPPYATISRVSGYLVDADFHSTLSPFCKQFT